jgi:D-beta-D-heptose 7-phosphate kinase / D-beta-D-heptose 1-phosphate adenosyltransferase
LVERLLAKEKVTGSSPASRSKLSSFMKKIFLLNELGPIVEREKAKGKKISLITGCFDIVHPGHIGLLRFAKKQSDILIVGLENDQTIRVSKGEPRPIFNLEARMDFLSELSSVDYLFPIDPVTKFGSKNADKLYDLILQTLRPDCLVTNPDHDRFWEIKKAKIEEFGGRILLEKRKVNISTSKIAEVIIKNFS